MFEFYLIGLLVTLGFVFGIFYEQEDGQVPEFDIEGVCFTIVVVLFWPLFWAALIKINHGDWWREQWTKVKNQISRIN